MTPYILIRIYASGFAGFHNLLNKSCRLRGIVQVKEGLFMSKTPFNLLHVREYESGGEKKTNYTRIGVAFQIDGGFALQVDDGLALTGKALILPRKDRAEQEEG